MTPKIGPVSYLSQSSLRSLLHWLRANRMLWITASLFWVVMTFSILNRHFAMYPSFSSHDQGIFTQIFWNGIHGHLFEGTLSSGESAAVQLDNQLPQVTYRRLGQHFTPVHLLWLPIYKLLPFSATLLVLQVTLVTAGGIALYFLARQHLSQQLAFWITLSYYCATAVIAPNLANFHDFSQIPLFVFLMLLAAEQKRWVWAAVAMLLVLCCREDTGIILFSIGLNFCVSRRYPRFGASLCVVSVGHLLLTTNVLMPSFSEDIGANFLSTSYAQYVDGQDVSTLKLIWGILKRPDLVLVDLLTPISRTIRFLAGHWLPLVFVPTVSPAAWLNTAAPLSALLLRQDAHLALSMQLRYTVMVVPGLFYGTILWWAQRSQKLSRLTRRFWVVCLCLSLVFTFTLNPVRTWSFLIPDSVDPWVHLSLPQQWHHAQEVRTLLRQIPRDGSVSATDHLLPHVSNRRAVLRWPTLLYLNDMDKADSVEFVILDLWQLQQYQAAFSGSREQLQAWIPLTQELMDDQGYGMVAATSGVFLLSRNGPTTPEALSAWQAFVALAL